jgi:hypothetical protein
MNGRGNAKTGSDRRQNIVTHTQVRCKQRRELRTTSRQLGTAGKPLLERTQARCEQRREMKSSDASNLEVAVAGKTLLARAQA